MIVRELIPGSPEWLAYRSEKTRRNASEASAMMGASKNTTRNELLHMKATATQKEFSDWVRKHILDAGHASEEAARHIEEERLSEELFPISVADDDEYLSASLDGATESVEIIWEHKQWNKAKADSVLAGIIPEEDKWQVVQQLVITGAKHCVYTVSDGTTENRVSMEYSLQPDDEKRLRAGWAQFDKDLDNYTPEEKKPEVVAEAVKDLPAVFVEVKGEVAVQNNFSTFEKALRFFLDEILIDDPRTDQDFANLDLQIKALKKAEDALQSAESYMLAQIQEVSDLKQTKDMLYDLARKNRLASEKLLAAQKEKIKLEIRDGAINAFKDHVSELNKRLGNAYMPTIATDFPGVMKNKRTIESLQNAVDTELARAKIEADDIADKISSNLESLRELASDYKHLFADVRELVMKPNDDLVTLIKARITEHEAELKRKADELAEQAREKIRAEEAAKLEADKSSRQAAGLGQDAERDEGAIPRSLEELGVDMASGPDTCVEAEFSGGKITHVEPAPHTSGQVAGVSGGTVTNGVTKATVVNKLELLKAVVNGELPDDLIQVDMLAVTALCAKKNGPIPGTTWGKA